jgi:sugar phosphate isomerase/epimerase
MSMKPCLSEATTMPASFVEDIEAYSASGVTAVEVWLTKLETALESIPAANLKKLLEDKQVKPVAASYQGGLLLSQGAARHTHFDHFRKRLEICQEFGIGTLLLVADFVGQFGATDLERAVASLRQAAQWAEGFEVRLALEFRGADTFCSCLETALQLVEHCGEANVGVNLDVFHFYKGPSKLEDMDRLNAKNLAFVQICDVAGMPRELMTDSDRILPGEGDFQLSSIMERLRSIGYDGWVSLELMNPTLWQSKPAQVAELSWSSLARLLGG